MVWKLEVVKLKRSKFHVFIAGGGAACNAKPTLLIVLDLSEFHIVPTTPITRLQYFIFLNKKMPDRLWIVLLQHAAEMPVMLAAAHAAFYDLGLSFLKNLRDEHKIETEGL